MTHNGKTNTYSFIFDGMKIVLVPKKDHDQSKQVQEDNKSCVNLLTLAQFDKVVQKSELFMSYLKRWWKKR